MDVTTFQGQLGPALTPELVGKAVVDLTADPTTNRDYLLGAGGLTPVT